MIKNQKKSLNIALLLLTISIVLSITSCQILPSKTVNGSGGNSTAEDSNDSKVKISDVNQDVSALFEYQYGMKSAVPADDKFLRREYEDWKSNYITSSGTTGVNQFRVVRDKGSDFDTVSEGIGYGMLLAVYFNDQITFDRLYIYCLAHTNKGGLMHWKVNKFGTNVSEFNLQVPHGVPYSNTVTGAYPVIVYSNTNTGQLLDTNLSGITIPLCKEITAYKTNIANHTPAAQNDRKKTSATDADVDIAAALCFAAKVWGKSQPLTGFANVPYINEAKRMINQIMKLDMHTGWGNPTADVNFWVGNGYYEGGTWGGNDPAEKPGWYPCYFTPAWYRIFQEVSGDAQWGALLTKMYNAFDLLDTVNGTAGLYPDACDTSSGTNVLQTTIASDRIPYNRESFNFYYDSVRVPWRLALDYSWNGENAALTRVVKMGTFFKSKGDIANIKDGYYLDGTTWSYAFCNSNNVNWKGELNGGLYHSSTFSAMCGTVVLALGDTNYATNFYKDIVGNKDAYNDPNNPYHYYGNTVRLLSLLYLSGRFVNLWDPPLVRKPAQNVAAGPLTIDLAYTNYGVYGLTQCEFHDRAKLMNADGSDFADIGAGILNSSAGGEMNLGYYAHMKNAHCGLPNLAYRSARVHGNILARANITVQGQLYMPDFGFVYSNMNKDVGCMDFKVDMSKFTPDMNNNINLEPGNSVNLTARNYGDIQLKGRNKVYYAGGSYHFNSFNAEPSVTNCFDTTSGPVIIYVKGDFNMKSRNVMLNKDGTQPVDASKVLFVVGSANTVYVASDAKWRGTLIAPNSSYVNIDTGAGGVVGAIWGKFTVIHQNIVVNFVPFDWATAIAKGMIAKK